MSLVPPDPPLSDGVIILRPLDESDLPTIERAAADAEILKWFDLHERSSADYLAAKREAWAEGTGASFAICDATRPDTCLGQVFIERDHDGRGSVGYWLLEDGRGKGRATRAVRLVASWALAEMRLGRLQLHTDPENVASQRVAERAGFTREGVLRAYNGRSDGTRADAFVYSLLPRDLALRNDAGATASTHGGSGGRRRGC
jgi:RimJ/RimL family protein N-acetyltransferase